MQRKQDPQKRIQNKTKQELLYCAGVDLMWMRGLFNHRPAPYTNKVKQVRPATPPTYFHGFGERG